MGKIIKHENKGRDCKGNDIHIKIYSYKDKLIWIKFWNPRATDKNIGATHTHSIGIY